MTEIIITEPSISNILHYIKTDIGLIASIFLGVLYIAFKFSTMHFDVTNELLNVSLKSVVIIILAIVSVVLIFYSSTLKFVADISFENINVIEVEAIIHKNYSGDYQFDANGKKVKFKVDPLQELYLDIYFKDKECMIEYYKQSKRVKKITLNQ